ncbi:fimbrial protein [Citrobacter sp. NCU1]|uniref:fimbrial protein n=1 Tax=Citrobacter sp. NCU1 TaxID=2026683 RepID=UPI001390C6FD|nr:fimbrial protein [Citrobacter sp. NCU1]
MKKRYHLSLTLLTSTLLASALAEDHWSSDGKHGELHLYGSLHEGACQLDMHSAYQEVAMDNIPRGLLLHPGDNGVSVPFTLRLLDCQRTGGTQTNRTTQTVMWDPIQPVITVSFESAVNADNPSLLLMKGIKGVGLMIRDAKGRQVTPGERSAPQFLSLGDNQLSYTVTPVRTQGELVTGTFRTVVDFKVSYD